MKKKSLIITGLLLFVISIFLIITNCTKEKELPIAKNNAEILDVKLENGIIAFADTSVYIKVLTELNELNNEKLAEWETSYPGFSSFNKYCLQNGLDTTRKDYDAAFFTVLNENKELIIGNYYFKLNFENRTLAAKPNVGGSLKSTSSEVEEMQFSFDENVIERLSQKSSQLKAVSSVLTEETCGDNDSYWVTMQLKKWTSKI